MSNQLNKSVPSDFSSDFSSEFSEFIYSADLISEQSPQSILIPEISGAGAATSKERSILVLFKIMPTDRIVAVSVNKPGSINTSSSFERINSEMIINGMCRTVKVGDTLNFVTEEFQGTSVYVLLYSLT